MTLTAALLLILSALAHAGWNLFSKTDHPSTASFLLANIFGTLLIVPLLVIGRTQVLEMIFQLWPLLLLTGFFQALYFSGLAYAYKKGELSVAYPLARSLPALMVTVVVFLYGEGDVIGGPVLGGIFLIIVGGFLIPLQSFNDFSLRRYRSVAVGAALVAAAGTAGYSLTDDFALELARGGRTATLHENFLLAFYYIGLQGVTTVFWQGLAVILSRNERQLFIHQCRHPASSIGKGAGIMLTYGLVLISMGYVTNVSYVVAFRQLSIPIGLVFGILFLKERAHTTKVTAVALLFAGVILVGLG
jgi:drug/metabolite transporter (DMT)-like permease